MKKTIFILLFPLLGWAQLSQPRDIDFVKSFIAPFKTQDIAAITAFIEFPLYRPYPIENIQDSTEFASRFEEFFDAELISEITASDPEKNWRKMGYQGIMLNKGSLWLDPYERKLISVNHKNPKTNRLLERATVLQKANLHSSLRDFETAVLLMTTEKFTIRIDRLKDGEYRYASWGRSKKMNQKPDLVLVGGSKSFEGSGGNHSYSFTHKNYTYICQIYVLGFKNIPAELQVYKGKTLFHAEVANKIDY